MLCATPCRGVVALATVVFDVTAGVKIPEIIAEDSPRNRDSLKERNLLSAADDERGDFSGLLRSHHFS